MHEQIKRFDTQPKNSKERFMNNEKKRQELALALRKISLKINEELGIKLLSDDGSISMKSYGYSKDELSLDKKYIQEHDDIFVRERRGLTKDAFVTTEMRQEQENELNRTPAKLLEMSMMILSYKVNKNYIMTRSAKYDDYRHGVDSILVNRKNGQVVCTLDEVHDTYGVFESSKKDKQITSAKYGGNKIKYGFTFEKEQIVKKQFKNIPCFYMSLSTKEFTDAMAIINLNNLDETSQEEIDLYNSIINKFEGQSDLLRSIGTNKEFLKNLDSFEEILPSLYQNK